MMKKPSINDTLEDPCKDHCAKEALAMQDVRKEVCSTCCPPPHHHDPTDTNDPYMAEVHRIFCSIKKLLFGITMRIPVHY